MPCWRGGVIQAPVALFYVMLAGNILIITILSYLAVLRTRTPYLRPLCGTSS